MPVGGSPGPQSSWSIWEGREEVGWLSRGGDALASGTILEEAPWGHLWEF